MELIQDRVVFSNREYYLPKGYFKKSKKIVKVGLDNNISTQEEIKPFIIVRNKIGEYCFVQYKKSGIWIDDVLLESIINDKDKLILFFLDRDIFLTDYSAQLLSDYLISFIKENNHKLVKYKSNIFKEESPFFTQLALVSFVFLLVYIKLHFFG
ncbi:MAG: hypothetical protein U0354_13965 [Candidatus Sericytochromatia bacterium]